jgi:predicted nuclease of predicted toxin-antitoxin system
LPNQNATQDLDIVKRSMAEKRVVISKDFDFYDRFFRKLEPYKLLYISTGNIPNPQLLSIFRANLPGISQVLETGFVVEITRNSIIVID